MLAPSHEWWEPHTYLDPDVPRCSRPCANGGSIGVLSNTIWSRDDTSGSLPATSVLRLIDGAVYTSEIPWTKPHPEAFRAALAAVGVDDAGEAVFVGDRPFDDIHGAKSPACGRPGAAQHDPRRCSAATSKGGPTRSSTRLCRPARDRRRLALSADPPRTRRTRALVGRVVG